MAIFTPKVIATTLSTGGVSVGGGGAILLKQMPKNYREQLTKEGAYLLNKDDEYKAIYEDHKDKSYGTGDDDLKTASTADDAKSKLKTYCDGKFQGSVPWISNSDYVETKKKLIALCTSKGLKSVKARLIQSGKDGNWIDENTGTEKYKAVFAVYRYNSDFIKGLKEENSSDSGSSNLSQSSDVNDNYEKLKNACTNLLKKPYKEINDNKYFFYASWWCVELGHATIKDRLQEKVTDWQAKEDSDSDWDTVKNEGQHTEQVKTWAQKAQGDSSSSSGDLTVEGLKKLCGNDNINSKLSENESYRDKYIVIKSVCKKKSKATA